MDNKEHGQVVPLSGGSRKRTGSSTALKFYAAPPAWLEAWRVSEPVPVTLQEVERCLMMCRTALNPATEAQIAKALAPLVLLFGEPTNFEAKLSVYQAALGTVPPDLLERAVFACLRDLSYFPFPGRIRDQIRDELAERQSTVQRLETALMMARRQQKERA